MDGVSVLCWVRAVIQAWLGVPGVGPEHPHWAREDCAREHGGRSSVTQLLDLVSGALGKLPEVGTSELSSRG